MKRPLLAAIAALAALGGCAVGPDYQRPAGELPASFPPVDLRAATQTDAVVSSQWWHLYADDTLNHLLDAALARNLDLRLALAQLDEAEGALREATASLFPEIDLSAGASRGRVNQYSTTLGVPYVYSSRQLTLSTSYELDFWGRLRRADEAARARALASQYGRDLVALNIASATTQSYFALRALDAQVVVVRETLRSLDESLYVARKRADAGLTSDLDVNQAVSARASAATQLSDLLRQRANIEHQLGVLTGQLDVEVAAGPLNSLPVPPVPPIGLPVALLERRPDVQQAEQQLVSANANIGIARAAFFPTVSLTASNGQSAPGIADFFAVGARMWSAGFALGLPIFDWGKTSARVSQAEARAQQAVILYQRSAQTAYREVADALSNLARTTESETDYAQGVDAARNSLRLSQRRYSSGYSPYLEVLDAERTLNEAQLALIRNRQTRLNASVDLIKALGGGWSAASSTR